MGSNHGLVGSELALERLSGSFARELTHLLGHGVRENIFLLSNKPCHDIIRSAFGLVLAISNRVPAFLYQSARGKCQRKTQMFLGFSSARMAIGS